MTNLLIDGFRDEPHITSQQWADTNMGVYGDGDLVLPLGSLMRARVQDPNTVNILDGAGIIQGRRFLIENGRPETVTIKNAVAAAGRKDYIVIHYEKSSADYTEKMEVRVIEGSSSGEVPQPAPNYYEPYTVIRDGSLRHDFALYIASKAKSGGLTIEPLPDMDGGADPIEPTAPHILKTIPMIHGVGGVTNDNLAGGITGDKIAAGAIANPQLANGIAWSKMNGNIPLAQIPQFPATKVNGGVMFEIPDFTDKKLTKNWSHGSAVKVTAEGYYIVTFYSQIIYTNVKQHGAIENAVLIGMTDDGHYWDVHRMFTEQGVDNSQGTGVRGCFVTHIEANTNVRFAASATENYNDDDEEVRSQMSAGKVTYIGA
jgi:hypothetical protein